MTELSVEAAAPLRVLLNEAHATARKAHVLRSRLEEHLSLPVEQPVYNVRGGQAAVLAEAILGSAAAQKMVELVSWAERQLEFVRTLWPLAYFHSLHDVEEAAQLVYIRSMARMRVAGNGTRVGAIRRGRLEYETTTAEDEEVSTAEGDPEEMERRDEEQIRVEVNMYLYMEDDLAAAAQGLVSMPKLSNAIAEGLAACRGVNMGFCCVVAAHRETARLLLRAADVPGAVRAQMLRALEEAVMEVCDAVRSVLRAVHRGIALMQIAMDGVETDAAKGRKTAAQ